MSENESKTYELAYHLSPDLEEADIQAQAKELADKVIEDGGSIVTSTVPKRIHLSYPINNKQYANFGVMTFTAPAETIEKLNAQMKLQNNIMRYLLTKVPHDGKELRTLGEHRAYPRAKIAKTHEAGVTDKEKAKPIDEAAKKEMESEIEKVIEGL
jgi:ribosomal protein S6